MTVSPDVDRVGQKVSDGCPALATDEGHEERHKQLVAEELIEIKVNLADHPTLSWRRWERFVTL